jgi:hypothetical protein
MAYAVDANVFINAHRLYYSFGICPGFWESVMYHHGQGHVFSIDRVRDEMAGKGDQLATWVENNALDGCFESTDTPEIITAYGQLVTWVNAQQQFTPAAKAEFSQKADAWLIAYAKVTGKTLVTHEVFNAEIRRKVPIPNVCQAFDVDHVDTFEMLSTLGASYHWNQPQPPADWMDK